MVYGKQMVHLTDVFKDEQHRKDWQFWSRDETDDEAILRRAVRDAYEFQLKYRACAQAVLHSLAFHLGLLREREAIVAMTTLCGGFGGTEICGALVGALAAIGLEFGRVDFSELGGPHTRGHSSFTLAQALAAEAIQRFRDRTSGLIRCTDLCYKYFGTHTTPPDRNDPMQMERIKAGELYSMWSVEASELTDLAAEIDCEIILRSRRQRGIVTSLMTFPWYNRIWELMKLTESLKTKEG
jgi:C_GCAxxG_C_C family probable redox protein